ncbi:MAG: ATP-binding protein [Actinomycetota bacterium]|nr:ATP-binding protein [Actinomycetota bacterium]
MSVFVRPYQDRDLASLLQLWGRATHGPDRSDLLAVDEGVDLLHVSGASCLVADDNGSIGGFALGFAAGPIGWVLRVVVATEVTDDDLIRRLLDELEARLAEAGTRKLIALVVHDETIQAQLNERGYANARSALCMERPVPTSLAGASALGDLGGRMVEPGLWESMKGLKDAKEIIERRVILPLAEPQLAARHAVSPPSAIVLFGPPGTGKTTFAKGVASRVAWPFVEIQPSQLAAEGPERQAELLSQTFDRIFDLPSAVVFVDEVEDVASQRGEDRRVNVSVTNEFLKQIPRFRDVPHHLLACATNWISRLDSAFLRPGRFDYVLPVGPPDAEARASIWRRYVEEITEETIDIDALVTATEFFTPADIEFAARKAAHLAFEREHFQGPGKRAVMDDFLRALKETRPTLSAELVQEFNTDTESFARY